MVKPDSFATELNALWKQARAGNEVAYAAALHLISERLRGYFARRLSSLSDETEDLVQETLIAVHTKRDTHDPALPVENWVFAIAGYKLTDFWRRHGRRDALHQPLDLVGEEALPAAADDPGTRRDLDALLDTLPPQQRAAIVMTRIEGLSMLEASKRSGVSVSALKVQAHRGLKRLAAMVRVKK